MNHATYEYQFQSCGLKFEHRQSISEEPFTECPECRGKMHPLIGGVQVYLFGDRCDQKIFSTDLRLSYNYPVLLISTGEGLEQEIFANEKMTPHPTNCFKRSFPLSHVLSNCSSAQFRLLT